MLRLDINRKTLVLSFKLATVCIGVLILIMGGSYLVTMIRLLLEGVPFNMDLVFTLVAFFGCMISGSALIIALPDSLRVRFRRPDLKGISRPTYGFTTLLAIGIGSTIGSPLFVIIPENIVEYSILSVGSLIIAAALSLLMAKVYRDMNAYANEKSLDAVGGPAFSREALGQRSLRYFITRFSMWIANTALAAFSSIFFILFAFSVVPSLLSGLGFSPLISQAIVFIVISIFVFWFLINAFFENTFLRGIGRVQIVMVIVMVSILVIQSAAIFSKTSFNLSGILHLSSGSPVIALITNTGYLFILFFGFQEIQVLNRETVDESSIPIYTKITGKKVTRVTYMGLAMALTVIISATVEIFYGLAIYSLHPNLASLYASNIPALYVAREYFSPLWEVVVAISFMIATITTFVPAFLAASRHLKALSEDGYFPASFGSLSWAFTLIVITVLSFAGSDFLVNITDFMVLISLGLINFSSLWLRHVSFRALKRKDFYPIIVGTMCFIVGISVYLLSPSVVLLGFLAILLSFLVYDIINLGSIGLQIFIIIFNLVSFYVFSVFRFSLKGYGIDSSSFIGEIGRNALIVAPMVLLISSILLSINVLTDVLVLRRTRIKAQSYEQ
ncbi:MAG: APC family permease [Thermoplasmataceae archaeon]